MGRRPDISLRLKKIKGVAAITLIAGQMNTRAYVVGGFVRDFYLSKTVSDELDLLVVGDGVTFAESVAKELGVEQINVFRNFGTAHFKYAGTNYEFVGSRKESYTESSRNPIVSSGTFEDDIARRDFTVNALCVSLNEDDFGSLIDPYNGMADLKNGILRTPLDPDITFSDDPLRMMRCVRFAAKLGFTFAPGLVEAIERNRERIRIIVQERITDEFLKILATPKPSVGLIPLYTTGLMKEIFPEVALLGGTEQRQEFHHKDVFYHTALVVDNISRNTENLWLRFAALMHDIAKPQTKRFVDGVGWTFHGHEDLGAKMMKRIFVRMRLPFHKLEYIRKLVRLHLRPAALAKEGITDSAIRRLIVEAGDDLDDLLTLCRADITSKNPQRVNKVLSNYEYVASKIIEVREKDRLRAFQSPLRGDEIMQMAGLPPGRLVGMIKDSIEDAILEGKISNDYDSALRYFNEIKDDYLQRFNPNGKPR